MAATCLAVNYVATKNYQAADRTVDRGLEVAPESLALRAVKAQLAVDWKGDVRGMEEELAQVPPGVDPKGLVTLGRVQILFLERQFSDALRVLQESKQDAFPRNLAGPKPFLEGLAYHFMNDQAKAREAFDRARVMAQAAVRDAPNDASGHATLGLILAFLGQKEPAITEGKRAAELLPESKDTFSGPQMTMMLAQIYAWTGERDQALQLLERSLSTPNYAPVSQARSNVGSAPA